MLGFTVLWFMFEPVMDLLCCIGVSFFIGESVDISFKKSNNYYLYTYYL